MKDVVVIGAGFAGLQALRQLTRYKKHIRATLIDQKETFDFLPCLPDIVSGKIQPRRLKLSLAGVCRSYGCLFINEAVTRIDKDKKKIFTTQSEIGFDYLLVASGLSTNYYGNEEFKQYACSLENIGDAVGLHERVANGGHDTIVVAGAGYTGIEIATHINYLLRRIKVQKRIVIVERGQVPLAALPEWVRRYVRQSLRKYAIELFCDSTIVKAGERSVWLASGQTFNNALFVWSAGMAAGRHIESLAVAKNSQGRIIVDDYLSFGESCFAAGDAACILHKGQTLRMAVQFALIQGRQAAYNILRSIVKMPLKKYRPLDLGWIVPMADNRACGIALGVSLQGYWAGLLHYSFCLLRLPGLKARWGMIKDLLGCQCQKS